MAHHLAQHTAVSQAPFQTLLLQAQAAKVGCAGDEHSQGVRVERFLQEPEGPEFVHDGYRLIHVVVSRHYNRRWHVLALIHPPAAVMTAYPDMKKGEDD